MCYVTWEESPGQDPGGMTSHHDSHRGGFVAKFRSVMLPSELQKLSDFLSFLGFGTVTKEMLSSVPYPLSTQERDASPCASSRLRLSTLGPGSAGGSEPSSCRAHPTEGTPTLGSDL